MSYREDVLGNITEAIFSGGTPSTRNSEYWDGNYNWLSSGETSRDFINSTDRMITELGIENSSTQLAIQGDVVMASAGQGKTRGQTSLLLIDTYINQSVIALRVNDSVLNNKYLYYNLKSRYRELRAISDSSSIRGSITTKMLKEFPIILPDVNIQRTVANFLYAFDQKIENNNNIIANLEAQARAIFKFWFIDFEPFQDGEFVESELGLIPEGWNIVTIEELSKSVITGKTPPTKNKENYGNYMPFIKIPDMHNKVFAMETEISLSESGMKIQEKKTLPENSICVSCIATVGLVTLTSVSSQTNQQINAIIPKENISPYYIYSAMSNMYEYLNAIGSSGSTTKNINKTTFEAIKLINPEKQYMDKYHDISFPMFEKIKNLQMQNQTLAQLRDTLLPKLMSGEIDVSNVSV